MALWLAGISCYKDSFLPKSEGLEEFLQHVWVKYVNPSGYTVLMMD
jgi:hypothetical protein